MPKLRTLILISVTVLVLVALSLILWLFPKTTETDSSDEETAQLLIDQNALDEIDAISLQYNDNAPLSFHLSEKGWITEGRDNLTISETNVNALLGKLESLLALRTVTEQCDDLSEYGLDSPTCQISLTANQIVKTYLFGSYNKICDGYYFMIEGENTVYVVDASYAEQFDLTMEDMLGSDRLPDMGSLQSVKWQTSDGNSFTALPDGEHGDLITLLSSLELGKWIDYGSEQYSLFGLDTPAVATVTLWDGATLTLSFGEGESEEFVYLRVDESELIYLAVCDDLARLNEYIRGEY